MINILIRTSNREELFWRALNSVREQSYDKIKVIVSYDNPQALRYIPDSVDRIEVTPKKSRRYFWNLYCNRLKDEVTEGWFMYLDDDNYLKSPEVIARLMHFIENQPNKGIICRYSRNGKIKPNNELFKRHVIQWGRIDTACLVLHHSAKDLAKWDGKGPGGDYRFIKKISDQIALSWCDMVLVEMGNKLKGKMNNVSATTL